MAVVGYVINQLTRGKLSRNMAARADTELYRTGLRTGRNVDSMPHGSIRRSNGAQNLDREANTSGGWLIDFRVNQQLQYNFVVDPGQIRIYRDGSFLTRLVHQTSAVESLTIGSGGSGYALGESLVFTPVNSETAIDNTSGTESSVTALASHMGRCTIPPELLTINGDQIRVTLAANTVSDGMAITKMWIAEQKINYTNWWDINESTNSQLFFDSGNEGFDIGFGDTQESDALSFTVDQTKTYILSWIMSSDTAKDEIRTFQNGNTDFDMILFDPGVEAEIELETPSLTTHLYFNGSFVKTVDVIQTADSVTTAEATITGINESGAITELTIGKGGTGYVATPTVTVTTAGGSGASITATLTDAYYLPWTVDNYKETDWTTENETIWITHQDFKRTKIQRQSHDYIWTCDEVTCDPEPSVRFADTNGIKLKSSAQTVGGARTLTAETPLFNLSGTLTDWVGKTIYLREGYGRITGVTNSTVATWTIDADLGSSYASYTLDWEEGIESAHRGYAACCIVFQDRFYLSGFAGRPNTVAASTISDFENYNDLDPEDSTSAFVYTINSDKADVVHHIVAGAALQLLTDGAEWIMSGSPITPLNVGFDLQTTTGSARVKPITVDSETYFVSHQGDQLMAFRYSLDQDSFTVSNYTVVAGDILNNVKQLAYLRSWVDTQGNYIYCLNGDGTMAQLGVSIEQDILGWTEHDYNDNDRTINSVSVATTGVDIDTLTSRSSRLFMLLDDDTNRDFVMMSSYKMDNGRYVELDNWYRYTGASATVWDLTIGSDTIFTNKTVDVMAGDGRYLGRFTMSGETLTLNEAETEIIVGLPWSFEAEPMAFDLQAQNIFMKGQNLQLKYVDIDVGDTQYFVIKEAYTGRAEQEITFDKWDVTNFDAPLTAKTGITRVWMLVRTDEYNDAGRKIGLNFSSDKPLAFQLNGFTAWCEV